MAEPNFDCERQLRESSRPKREIRNNAFERAFKIKQVQGASCLRSPIRRGRDISAEQNPDMPFLFSGWRDECASDFKNGNAFCSGANISFEHFEQTADQARPKRDVIFAKRIPQLDRFAQSG